MKQEIIVFCGLPLSGKTTLARELSKRIEVLFIDIDQVRYETFHQPQEEMPQALTRFQMKVSYYLLAARAWQLVTSGLSVIIAATFSKEEYHQLLFLLSEVTNIPLRVIYLWAPDEVIAERIDLRGERQDSFSTCRTPDHYLADKARYQKLPLPPEVLLEVNTSRPIEQNIKRIVEFVTN